ncbi:FMN-dependent dehydrogenase [Xylariaceae sp. FL0804]|nr:FMN-dependent dehydrogenase [Xylariaceae sp. FL0804]
MADDKIISAEEVAKHTTAESCWVVLYGNVYDITEFLPSHPGGSKVILQLAGTDATDEYDPIHPPGTLEANLRPEARLGRVDPDTLVRPGDVGAKDERKPGGGDDGDDDEPPPLESLLNLREIEEAAHARISDKAWAYYHSSADDGVSKARNGAAYRDVLLRPRVFVDCTRCDSSTTLLSRSPPRSLPGLTAAKQQQQEPLLRVGLPVFVAPAAMARLAHADGEAGIARACARFGAAQVVSNNASMTPEQVVAGAAPGQVFGWQLYVQTDRAKSEAMLARVNRLRDHFRFVVLTLDAPVPGKRELDEKQAFKKLAARAANSATAAASKTVSAAASAATSAGVRGDGEPPLAEGGAVGQQLFQGTAADLTWRTTLDWLAAHTDLPIVLKGVQTHEDAYLAARHHAPRVAGIILSNHGGRALDTAPPALHTLLEIRRHCPDVLDRLDVWVDGGVGRGTDVVKALCLGATAVGIGRPALFGLGAGGQAGVERVLESEFPRAAFYSCSPPSPFCSCPLPLLSMSCFHALLPGHLAFFLLPSPPTFIRKVFGSW